MTRRISLKLKFQRTDIPTAELDGQLPHTRSTEEQALSDGSDQAVRRAVARLPKSMAEPVALHHLQGLSVPEIAVLLDLPMATVRGRIYRG